MGRKVGNYNEKRPLSCHPCSALVDIDLQIEVIVEEMEIITKVTSTILLLMVGTIVILVMQRKRRSII